MRLDNSARLHDIAILGLSEPVFRASEKLLAIGEKLKDAEQSLLFLQRCRKEQIFSLFILNNVRAPNQFFPIKFSTFQSKTLSELRRSCLNQHIQFKYTYIEELKSDSILIRNYLRDSATPHFEYILNLYFSNNDQTKIDSKMRLFNKFNWLVYKHYLPCWQNGERYNSSFSYIAIYHQMKRCDTFQQLPPTFHPSPATHPCLPTPPDQPTATLSLPEVPTIPTSPTLAPEEPPSIPLAPPREKVTLVNVSEDVIDESTLSLLGLGPGFAISPLLDKKGKEALLSAIQERIAEMAINIRWKERLASFHSAKTLKQHLKGIAPFEQIYTRAPPLAEATIENKLASLRHDLINITKSSKVTPNLTPDQRNALKHLRKNDELQISIADKTAEFVVMRKEDHILATTSHFANTDVYKKLEMPQDTKGAATFIKKLTGSLEQDVNSTFRRIAKERKIPQDAIELLMSHHTNLPTARVMLKTHKYTQEQICNLDPLTMKTRPIVSGCNSPFHEILWFICELLSPLMTLVPTHLKNTFDFLQRIRNVSPNTLKNLTFFTADVEALYTNINVQTAIEDVLEFAKENRRSINTYGLHLSDIQELLELTLGKSYFVYNRQVYLQLLGLFMGSNPAPVLATVKMWKLERNSVYTDLRITLPTYSRFYDDLNEATSIKRKAQQLCDFIQQQDSDGLIKLTLDYPANRSDYVPFLNTEIKIDPDRQVQSRLFRKAQEMPLTLQYNSHHTDRTKIARVESMYNTAETVSSSVENKTYSKHLVDKLLLNNGYTNRVLEQI